MTDFILEKLETGFETPEYRWSAMLNPMPAETTKKKTAAKKANSETATKTVKAKTTKTKTAKAKKASDSA